MSDTRERWLRWGPGLILALGAAVRLAVWQEWRAWPGSSVAVLDAGWHLRWGAQMAAGTASAETWVVAPGMAALFAAIERIFGAGTGPAAATLLALDLALVEGIRRLGARTGGAEVGLLAGLLAAIGAPLPFHAVHLLGTDPPLLLLCGALLLLVGGGRGRAVFAGLLLGLSCFFRPNHLVVMPVLALAAGWPGRDRAWVRGAALAGGFALGLLPGLLRNGLVAGEWVPLSANAGANLYMAQEPGSWSYESAPPPGPVNLENMTASMRAEAEAAAGHALSPAQADAWWMERAKARIAEDPWGFLGRTAGRLYVALATWGVHDHYAYPAWRRDRPLWGALPDLGFLLPGLGAVGAAALWARGRRDEVRLLLAASLGVALSLAPFTIVERYRLSALVGLLPLAAVGLWAIFQADRPGRPIAIALATSLALSLDPFHGRLVLPDLLAVPPITSWSDQSGPGREAGEASNLAAALLRAGDLATAETFLRRALDIDPARPDDQVALAAVLLQRGETDEAVGRLTEALVTNPRHANAAITLCGAMLRVEVPDDALFQICELATNNAPERGEAWFQLGLARWKLGDLVGAEGAVLKALSLTPGLPRGKEALEAIRAQLAQRAAAAEAAPTP